MKLLEIKLIWQRLRKAYWKQNQRDLYLATLWEAFEIVICLVNSVNLTFQGKNMFKTTYGGSFSIILLILLFTYMAILFDQLIHKGATNVSQYVTLRNNINNDEALNIGQEGMGIAIQFKSGDVDLLSDNDYITFEMNLVIQTRENGTTTKIKYDMPYELWNYNFPYPDDSEITRLGINTYYCPQTYDYVLKGTYYSDSFEYIELKVYRWNDNSSWKTTDEIDTILETGKFEIAIIDFYVDNSDYVSPVKSLIRDGLFWNTIPGYDIKSDIYIGQNYGIFQDNYFQFYNSYEKSFYSLMDRRDYSSVEVSDGELIALYFRTYSYESSSERRIYSFGDFLAQSGGVYGIFLIIGKRALVNYNLGGFIMSIFTDRLYASSLLRKIYQIDTYKDEWRLNKTKAKLSDTKTRFDSVIKFNDNELNLDKEIWESDQYRDKVLKNMKRIEKHPNDLQKQQAFLDSTLKGNVTFIVNHAF